MLPLCLHNAYSHILLRMVHQGLVLVAGTWHHCRHREYPQAAIRIPIMQEDWRCQQENQLKQDKKMFIRISAYLFEGSITRISFCLLSGFCICIRWNNQWSASSCLYSLPQPLQCSKLPDPLPHSLHIFISWHSRLSLGISTLTAFSNASLSSLLSMSTNHLAPPPS